jgi:hypothetical protein
MGEPHADLVEDHTSRGCARIVVSSGRRTGLRASPNRCALALCLFGLSAMAVGCGGAMRPDELAVSVRTLASSAASGELLARDVANDRTKLTFARSYARELSEVVDHEAEKLSDARAQVRISAEKAQAERLAGRISEALGAIQTSPGDEGAGRAAERQLRRLSEQATRLAGEL